MYDNIVLEIDPSQQTKLRHSNVVTTAVWVRLRLCIFRVYGVCRPEVPPSPGLLVDLAAAALGGVCVGRDTIH